MIRKVPLIFFLAFWIGSCSSSRTTSKDQSILIKENNCNLVRMEFDLADNYFERYQAEYEEFVMSTYKVDMLHFFSWSGTDDSYFTRLALIAEDSIKFFSKHDGVTIDTAFTDERIAGKLIHKIEKVRKGNYVNICHYFRSAPFYHTYLIKKRNEVYFRYYLSTSDYTDIEKDEINLIQNEIILLDALKELEKKFSSLHGAKD